MLALSSADHPADRDQPALAPHGDGRCRALLEELTARAGIEPVGADRLLARFGSLGAILANDRHALAAVSGDRQLAGLIDCLRRLNDHVMRSDIEERPLIAHEQAVIDYLRAGSAHARNEALHVLHLDAKNHLVHEQRFEGSVDEAPFNIREILRRALDVGSVSLILAHNHPSGDPTASEADREVTARLTRAAADVGIVLLDHIIVTRTRCFSFRLGKLV